MSRGQVRKLTTQKGHSHNEPSHIRHAARPRRRFIPQGPRLADRHDLHLPSSGYQAGREIERLTALKARRGRYLETPRQELDQAELPYATEQKPGEVIGYGANARRADQPRGCHSASAAAGRGGAIRARALHDELR